MTAPRDGQPPPEGQPPSEGQSPPESGAYGYPPPGYPPPAYPSAGYPGYGHPQAGYAGYGYPGYGYPGYGPPGTGRPPSSHLGWAIAALVFFWPLAIPAFINHSRVTNLFYRGDVAGAELAARRVRTFGIIAVVTAVSLIVLWIGGLLIAFHQDCGGWNQSC